MSQGQIYYVNPWEVVLDGDPHKRDVKYQRGLLNRQGQIVPLYAHRDKDGDWAVNNVDDYGLACAQVQAARELGWSTIIVTDSLESD